MDKDELIELKRSTVLLLRRIDVSKYGLDETDERLPIYLNQCIDNPDRHNLYELLAVKRFFEFMDKFEFRSGKVREFITLFEYLKFSGTSGSTTINATPVQVFQFANIK